LLDDYGLRLRHLRRTGLHGGYHAWADALLLKDDQILGLQDVQQAAGLVNAFLGRGLGTGAVQGHDRGHDPVDPLDVLLLGGLPELHKTASTPRASSRRRWWAA
jgi:hypothetical protein